MENTNEELKPCPFCGSEMASAGHPDEPCFMSNVLITNEDVAAWNRRAAPAAGTGTINGDLAAIEERAMQYRGTTHGGQAEAMRAGLMKMIREHGDARAEEARREEARREEARREEARREEARREEALAAIAVAVGVTGGPAEIVAAVRQRTAGGELVYQMRPTKGSQAGRQWHPTDADGPTCIARNPHWADLYEFRTLRVIEPVEEAAAQADGDEPVAGVPHTTRADVDRITVEQLWNRWIGDRNYGHLAKEAFIAARTIPPKRATAPTAQPTPREQADLAAWKRAMDEQAQPTPPDDELPSLPKPESHNDDGYIVVSYTAQQLRDYARAALRHPPVPNVGELPAIPEAVQRAFVTLESKSGAYSIVMKFNQSADAYEAHSFLLGAGGKDWPGAAPNPADEDAARYRFLRHADLQAIGAGHWPTGRVIDGAKLDDAIDAARAAAAKEKT